VIPINRSALLPAQLAIAPLVADQTAYWVHILWFSGARPD
jgi:hypothetical protein